SHGRTRSTGRRSPTSSPSSCSRTPPDPRGGARSGAMSVFAYRGRTAGGVITGEVEADDRMSVVAQLRAKGVVATSVQERAPRSRALASWQTRQRRAKDKHLAVYTRQFSTMIDAGLPIVQCLTVLSEQSESPVLRQV